MPMSPLRSLLTAGLLLVLPSLPARAVEPLPWPLDEVAPAITGTFMEPRSAHYHSGLDIKTGGRTGLRVLAPCAGWIRRVRCSPIGYGKALYLEREDGFTLVFAHLEAFADPIQRLVTRAQAADGRYEQDLPVDAGVLRVEAGDLLALSGATGTGAPHLHLEWRGPDERPRNPLQNGFQAPDERPPTVEAFRLVPLREDARVGGAARSAERAPGELLRAHGELGVQVRVSDRAGVHDHRLMPLALELRLDGQRVYRLEQRLFAFHQGGQMRLEIVRPGAQASDRWIRLYRREGNDLPGREATRPGASFHLPPDGLEHRLELIATDAAGNEGRASLRILATEATGDGEAFEASEGWGELRLESRCDERLLEIRVIADRPLRAADARALELRLLPAGAEHARPVALRPGPDGTLLAALDPARLASGRNRWQLRGEDGVERVRGERVMALGGSRFLPTAFEGGIRLEDPRGRGLYEGGFLWVDPADAPRRLPEGCRRLDGARRLVARGAVFRDDLEIWWPWPEGLAIERTAGLFLQDARGRWSFLGAERRTDEDGRLWIGGEVDAPGRVLLLEDPYPPYLGAWTLRGGQGLEGPLPLLRAREPGTRKGIALPRWPRLELPLRDPGAGLTPEGVRSWLDGRPYPARWDPEEERLYYEWEVDPGPGVHELRVEVTDALGRRSESVQRVELRER